jgi:hypothetical protein
MDIHIGSIIKSRSKAIRLGAKELGVRLETTKQNIYGIFKRKSIDTELLARISVALNHDFFQYLSKSLNGSITGTNEAGKPLPKVPVPPASTRNLDIERENEYLHRINALLEEKVKHLEKQLADKGKKE